MSAACLFFVKITSELCFVVVNFFQIVKNCSTNFAHFELFLGIKFVDFDKRAFQTLWIKYLRHRFMYSEEEFRGSLSYIIFYM
jgi:hypothetical protein